jgi:hypothetical protein
VAVRPDEPMEMVAAVADMIGRTGAQQFQIRFSDDEDPTIWMAAAQWKDVWECAAALTPDKASIRLAETVMDGGECTHCHKTTAVSHEWRLPTPLQKAVCWYVYDPETKKFRRSCEGE